MLRIVQSAKDLDFRQMFAVYDESICNHAENRYSREHPGMRVLMAQQDFVADWKTSLGDKTAFCALWVVDDAYTSVLRMDKYLDGMLLNTLETVPSARGKGYATILIKETINWLRNKDCHKVYSHIDKRNSVSAALHKSCGFSRLMDYAVYLDGSVFHTCDTFVLNIH